MYQAANARWLVFIGACVFLAGCGTPDPVAYRGIESSSYLRPDPRDDTGHVPYRYSTQVDWRSYSKVSLEPVVIYQGPDQQFDDMESSDKTELAKYMQTAFTKKLGERFQLVSDATPNTLRIKLTLTGAAATPTVIGPFTHFDLGGNLYNGVQSIRGGEGMASGAVIYAVEIFDAPTNRLLNAYVSKQYPNAMNFGAAFGSLSAAKTGIDKGAEALLAQLQ